ncbi:hypothetical protein FA95DRAFT_1565350 [Auriscalpium vulgare]|uniref:Uncharacterized protein n=1 Tax=Auriscalpium vulgare TaxID=40419 RepID=A0ACB8RCX5_9AGAM|nr:hypothetical protein FA95DRAFT_1565350 [Auriscalpium vulgare]
MSTRQNKKRKAKPNRERTVTTLTGNDDAPQLHSSQSSFVVPTSPDDAAATSTLMSSPFSVASSAAGATNTIVPIPHNFQMPQTFSAFPYASYVPQPQPQHQQQPQFYPNPALPIGLGDLEALERLKETIKSNQHEIFRAFPQPGFLATLYQGPPQPPPPPSSSVPPHPEQVPPTVANSPEGPPGLSASASSGSLGPRVPALSWDPPSVNGKPGMSSGGPLSNTPNVLSHDFPTSMSAFTYPLPQTTGSARYDATTNGDTGAPASEPIRPAAGRPATPDTQRSRPVVVKIEPTSPVGPGPVSRDLGRSDTGKDDLRSRVDATWSARDRPPSPGRRRSDSDRSSYAPYRATYDRDRAGPPRSHDRDREYDRERERDRDRYRDRDWERDRRPNPRDYPGSLEPPRRPPPEDRHYEPSARPHDRKWDRRPSPPPPSDRRPDHRPEPPTDDKSTRPPSGAASARPVPPSDDRVPPPRPPVDNRRPAPPSNEDRARPVGGPTPPENARPVVPSATEPPAPPRSGVSLEERISRERAPSLQERISAGPVPPVAPVRIEPPRPAARPVPSLEERLSRAPEDRVPPTAVSTNAVRPNDEISRPRPVDPPRPNVPHDRDTRLPASIANDRDRFPPSVEDRARPASFNRAPSVSREDTRAPPPPRLPSPSAPSTTRPPTENHSYRREPSRERNPEYRPYYRSEFDRPLEDDRSSDHMDGAGRYGNSWSSSYNSRYPPRPEDRRAAPSPPRGEPPYVADADRRRDPDDYNRYYNRNTEDRSYWERKDRPPPPTRGGGNWDRDTYRDAQPYSRYDERDRPRERDRERDWSYNSYDAPRPYPPPAPPPPPPTSLPLSARINDTWTGAPGADSYPAPASRVRPHSPSPARDDGRPPLKRPRDDAYPAPASAEYYSPPGLGLGKEPLPAAAAPSLGEYPPPPPARRYDGPGEGAGVYRDYGGYDRDRRSPGASYARR